MKASITMTGDDTVVKSFCTGGDCHAHECAEGMVLVTSTLLHPRVSIAIRPEDEAAMLRDVVRLGGIAGLLNDRGVDGVNFKPEGDGYRRHYGTQSLWYDAEEVMKFIERASHFLQDVEAYMASYEPTAA